MLFLPRRFRIICFLIVTPFQIGIILTANYTFLNYLVLVLGFLLLDDGFVRSVLPQRWKNWGKQDSTRATEITSLAVALCCLASSAVARRRGHLSWLGLLCDHGSAVCHDSLRTAASSGSGTRLDPFRIANQYGLFANMTHERYEIEFQGSSDGQNWTPYPFRYKPQDVRKAPGIYAPYQPRFEWDLWFASLGNWRNYPWVVQTEARLLQNEAGRAGALRLAILLATRRRRKCAP